MNLMKLLTVGRSLRGGEFLCGKYKLTQNMLPKFASTVRPSTCATPAQILENPEAPLLFAEMNGPAVVAKPSSLATKESSNRPNESERGRSRPRGSDMEATHPMENTQKIPTGKVLKRVEEPIPEREKFNFLAWSQNQISSMKKKLFPARSKRKTNSTPVQTEWSLEKVTVVRNDLSEADIEVVAPKAAVATATSKPRFANLSRVKQTGREWMKMTTQLFKTTSPFEKTPDERRAKADRAEFVGRI